MKFKDLLKKYKRQDILKRLFVLYPDQTSNLKGYKEVLKSLFKKKIRNSDMVLKVSWEKDGKDLYVVINANEDGTDWGVSLMTWSKVLGMEMDKETLLKFPGIDIVCHVLWEITWHGFNEKEIQVFGKELDFPRN